jgi:imidazolonepropionase-like amidohydrolase
LTANLGDIFAGQSPIWSVGPRASLSQSLKGAEVQPIFEQRAGNVVNIHLIRKPRIRRVNVATKRGGPASKSGALKKVVSFLFCTLAGIHLANGATMLSGARILDGTGRAPVEDGAIVFEGTRILNIGPADSFPRPPNSEVIDAHGKTIIPGLISAHSHLGLCQGIVGPKPENYTRANVQQQLEQYERYGVLTVMSLGVNKDVLYEWRNEQREGKFGGADIFTADRGLGVRLGAPPFPLLEDQVYRPDSVEEARADVRASAERHPDMIKIWVDDLSGTSPKMAPDIFREVIEQAPAITDEAHQRRLKVAVHIFYLNDAKALLEAGVDVIAHSVRDQPVDVAFVQAMKAKGAVYIPTLDLDESQYIFAEQPGWMQDPFFTQAVDKALLARWKSPLYAKEIEANPSTVKNKAAAAMGQRNVKTLFDAGVKIAFGTDSGALPTRIQGFAEHRELQLLVQAGLSSMDAIVCATKNSAEVIGASDRGTLEAGKKADFLILNGNPLDDIRNTTRIDRIYHGGRLVGGP